ncbi:hypothetical protein ACISK3_12765 [Morganella morganii]|nr:hypothetical protein [Morganella morganii]
MLNKKIFFILMVIIALLFSSLGVTSKIYSLLIDQVSRANFGHIQIYNKNYFSADQFDRGEFKIENYKEVIHALSMDKFLEDKVSDYSAQVEFTGIITNPAANKSIIFWGLGIQPESSIKIGSYDITTSGSDLSELDDNGIIVDDAIFQYLNLRYQSSVSIAIIDSTGKLRYFPYEVRGTFKTELKSTIHNLIKIPLRTVIDIFKSDSVNHINILLKNTSDINVVVKRINKISEEKNLNIKSINYFKYLRLQSGDINKISVAYYFLCFLIVVFSLIFLRKIYHKIFYKIKKDIKRLNVVHFSYGKLFFGLIVLSGFIIFSLSLSSIVLGFLFLCILQSGKVTDFFYINSECKGFFYIMDYDLFFTIPILLMLSSIMILLIFFIKNIRCFNFGVYHD